MGGDGGRSVVGGVTVSRIELLNDDVALWYHPEPKIIHHQIRGLLPPGALQKLLTKGAECLEQHHAQKWLSDDSQSVPIRPEDYEWGDKVWAPRVIKAGFRYWAIVLPEGAVAQLQMQRFCAEYRARGVTAELFTHEQRALEWLTQVDRAGRSGESAC